MKIVNMTPEEIEEYKNKKDKNLLVQAMGIVSDGLVKGAENINKKALKWWNTLPMQDIINCKEGWANYTMKYYPDKTDCQDLTNEEILFIYTKEVLNV